jgi:hypothetical protein
MLDSRLEDRYRNLEKQVKRWLKYVRVENWIGRSFIIAWFILVLAAITRGFNLFATGVSEYSTEQSIVTVLFMVYVFLAFGAMVLVRRKGLVYRPDADNLMLYHTCSILESLEDYHKSEPSALKEEFRKKAVKSGKGLLATAKKDWNLGDFGLAKKVYGGVISSILENLWKRVVPNLEREDEETLKKVEHALYQFAHYLLNPSLENLQQANKSMSDNLDSYETAKLGFVARCSAFFTTHTVPKHTIIVSLIFAVGFIPALLGLHYGRISTDSAFLLFGTIFGPLIAVYLSHVLRK